MLTHANLRTHLAVFSDNNGNDGAGVNAVTIRSTFRTNKWLALGAASSTIFVVVGLPNSFGVFQSYYESELFPSVRSSQITPMGSTSSSFYMILGALTGRFADTMGYQTSMVVGNVLVAGALSAASVSGELYQLYLSQGVMSGLGSSFVYHPAVTISGQYFGPRHHALANGVILSGGA
ncbi:hypothetical protein JX265_013258 [Neoarthrinium moseri]|uniref:Major facilitator superfamily (MFS) profile domain-containing protein n=1 Tax=Neoarthrinium moseri TaxID=1658444 RepID=A0A9P9W8Q5_9PEZI|nr:uncharacterized protein JN550_005018 [Neoarthrinium moseri]KAI1851140.1 hypothetical protein JX265_013258 [Neoarthrinium moseri]KAI1851873.1 hypothetical protein JX266_002726 [Neoarthrinium moseri]KAI1870872.1 hypothetical protein JN550_005018 [Neoarthrinium moseri]